MRVLSKTNIEIRKEEALPCLYAERSPRLNLMNEIQESVSLAETKLKELQTLLQELANQDVFSYRFPEDSAVKEKEAIEKIDVWFEGEGTKAYSALFQTFRALLHCYQRMIFLDALRMVFAFRLFKEEFYRQNKELSYKDRRDTVPYHVSVLMGDVGISIPWRRTEAKWKKGGARSLTESEYLPLEDGSFNQKANDFKGAGEHKKMLQNAFDAHFAECRRASAFLVTMSKTLGILEKRKK